MVYVKDTPNDTAEMDISFIDNNSFMLTPPSLSVASRNNTISNVGGAILPSISATPAVAAFLNTPFRPSKQPQNQTPGSTALQRTPSLPKASIPTLKEQEKVYSECP